MGGRDQSERLVAINWNRWSQSVGARTLVHWLPKSWFRAFLDWMGHHELAMEANLNLMTERELRKITVSHPDWSFHFRSGRLLGLKSNIVLFATRKT